MKRRHFLKNASMALTGASAAIPKVFGQGRDLRPIPPVAPPATKNIIDLHVHDFSRTRNPRMRSSLLSSTTVGLTRHTR